LKTVYFASDNHLGAPNHTQSRAREKLFVKWLDQIKYDADEIFLLGDLFDFWFEYKEVVPKGFTRVLGKLAEISDSGIPIYFFVGNHDLWMKDYFQNELGIEVFHQPQVFEFDNKKFYIGHGDGLGPFDKGYKRMKKVFIHPLSKWLFRWLHPDLGVRLARHLSVKNKLISGEEDKHFLGKSEEWLAQYAIKKQEETPVDYYLFGHRHLPMKIKIDHKAVYYNLGDWISHFTYGRLKEGKFQLMKYQPEREDVQADYYKE